MSDCCTPRKNNRIQIEVNADASCCEAAIMQTNICPVCGQKGKHIDHQTVRAMLDSDLRAVQNTGYYFCRTPNCDVVYFNEDGRQTFLTDDIRVWVYQKAPEAEDILVCYCFRYTVGDIHREMSAVVDAINAGVQAGQCACEIRNPQGSCCLGNVRAVVKQTMQEKV